MIDTTGGEDGNLAAAANQIKLVESLVISALTENQAGLTDDELEVMLKSRGVTVEQKVAAVNGLLG